MDAVIPWDTDLPMTQVQDKMCIRDSSDRILVIYNGRFVGEVDPGTATEEEIGLLMAGIVREGTAV